jgi:hypothetical protein
MSAAVSSSALEDVLLPGVPLIGHLEEKLISKG